MIEQRLVIALRACSGYSVPWPFSPPYAFPLANIHRTMYSSAAAKVRLCAMNLFAREAELRQQFEQNRIDFLFTELDTAATFCGVAQTADDPEKIKRNVKNAREGYDTILKFKDGALLDAHAKSEFDEKFFHLKSLLRELGEDV